MVSSIRPAARTVPRSEPEIDPDEATNASECRSWLLPDDFVVAPP